MLFFYLKKSTKLVLNVLEYHFVFQFPKFKLCASFDQINCMNLNYDKVRPVTTDLYHMFRQITVGNNILTVIL